MYTPRIKLTSIIYTTLALLLLSGNVYANYGCQNPNEARFDLVLNNLSGDDRNILVNFMRQGDENSAKGEYHEFLSKDHNDAMRITLCLTQAWNYENDKSKNNPYTVTIKWVQNTDQNSWNLYTLSNVLLDCNKIKGPERNIDYQRCFWSYNITSKSNGGGERYSKNPTNRKDGDGQLLRFQYSNNPCMSIKGHIYWHWDTMEDQPTIKDFYTECKSITDQHTIFMNLCRADGRCGAK